MNKILGALCVTIGVLALASPASATKNETTTTSSTTTTTTEVECVPEGTPVTDVETGETYLYNVPGLVGVDSCGNEIPDICVQWLDGSYSRLWTAWECGPEPEPTTPETTVETPETTISTPETTVPSTNPPSETPKLPETGTNEVIFVTIGAFTIAFGLILRQWARER